MVYVEFGDEEAMKAGLERSGQVCLCPTTPRDPSVRTHDILQKYKDTFPEVKQATDKESRNAENGGPFRGGPFGRGRGGRGFAARGFAAAGLTRGGAPGEQKKPNGDAAPPSGPKADEGS